MMRNDDEAQGLEVFEPSAFAEIADIGIGDTAEAEASGRHRGNRRWLGVAALVLAVSLAVIDGYAIAVATENDYELALLLAGVATIGTVVSFLAGAVALVVGRGRWWGLAAMLLSIAANPFTLVQLLVYFSDFTAN